jgi:hypothetical protein
VKARGLRNYVGVVSVRVAGTRAVSVVVAHSIAAVVSDAVAFLLSSGIGVLVHPGQAEIRDDGNGTRSVRVEHSRSNGQFYMVGVSQSWRRKRHGREWHQVSLAREFGFISAAAPTQAESGSSGFWFGWVKESKWSVGAA